MALREDDPESVGGYRIESRIGTGGMGVVYRARTPSGRAVAVKVVHGQYADDPEFRARFRQEVSAARRVSGAFTAPVVDADPDAALPWMATVYVSGDTLAQRVAARGPLDWPQLRRLGVELAEALREIHRAEVVHRDLKPSNVLLLDSGKDLTDGGADGAVRVIDFGISRAAQSDVRTQTGMVMGSPPFMAPEQFSHPREVGPPVDVFSFGALLVYAATGRSPFEADNAYLAAYQTVHHDPELGRLPGELRSLVLACLAKAPQDRPTPDELRDALAALPEETAAGEAGGDRTATAEDAAAGGEGAGDPDDRTPPGGPTLALAARPGSKTGSGSRPGLASEPRTEPRDGSGDDTPVTPNTAGPATASHPRARGGRRGRRFTVAVSALAVALVAAAGLSVALLTGSEDGAVREDARPARPDGWRAWHTVLPKADKDGPAGMMPNMLACTPSSLGVYCASESTALTRLDPLTGRVDWTRPLHRDDLHGGISVTEPEVVAGAGLVFTASADGTAGVDAYDAESGRRLWGEKGPLAEFRYLSGVLVVRVGELSASPSAEYAALDPRTGKELWRRTLATDSPSPLYAGTDGALVADLRRSGRGDRTVARLDARTGRTLGRVTAPKGDLWLATVHGDSAYYARWENDTGVSSRIFIQDLTSGRVRSVDFPWAVEPEAPPLVAGDTMYVFDYANEIVLALDLKRGKALWTTSRELRVFSEPTVSGDTLYATTPDSSVIAINTRTGKERWRTKPPVKDSGSSAIDERTPSGTGPLRVGDVLYALTEGGAFSVAVPGKS
ncbi:protein kinase domain-containing protein [Streptomyces longispororuber]|uniref:serine/threonine-protein kinase n=1 Tax=Streptomyces longispororuber TaxID=68230 RepID=UPI00210BB7AA|nr:serine/threonine-protein kinase [Streptomyces longispororuber]MCQ4212285.1 PQQ-binding-like beta-propeller repeat protein [Streptomyces longispororuber]